MPTNMTPQDMHKLRERLSEEYLVGQYHQIVDSETYVNHRQRLDDLRKVYRGEWSQVYPDGTSMPDEPAIENIVKNGIHDIASLAAEATPSVMFIPEKDGEEAYKDAQVREAITDTIWTMGHGKRLERRIYMDLITAGYCAVGAFKSKKSDYAQFARLKPERVWVDVRSGTIQDAVYLETVKLREIARQYPEHFGMVAPSDNSNVEVMDYYSDYMTVKAVIWTGSKDKKPMQNATIVDSWEHGLDRPTIAFAQLDTADDAFRGLMDQAAKPMIARNRIVTYMIDYIESMVHAPFESKNVLNAGDDPGPDTVYQHDPNSEDSFMRRVAPAAPAGAVFGLMEYLDRQSSGETVQPPSRQGQVSQSIASASFVTSTQGRLTTVVRELQDHMSDLRNQLNTICLMIEEEWLDRPKPLVRPVGKKRTYTPSKDIRGWYYHRVEFGATAGLDRLQGDVRVLQHLGARLISKKMAREQLDYVPDPTTQQAEIDLETIGDATIQRFAADPRTPMSALIQATVAMAKGATFVEALEEIQEKVEAAEQAAQQQGAGAPGGAPQSGQGIPVPQGEMGVDPASEELALERGQTEQAQPVNFALPPLQQQIVGNPGS